MTFPCMHYLCLPNFAMYGYVHIQNSDMIQTRYGPFAVNPCSSDEDQMNAVTCFWKGNTFQ